MPPIMSCDPLAIDTPVPPLAMAAVPFAFVPMRFPATTSRLPAEMRMPSDLFPEMTLAAPVATPPISSDFPPTIDTPAEPFGMAAVPVAFAPM